MTNIIITIWPANPEMLGMQTKPHFQCGQISKVGAPSRSAHQIQPHDVSVRSSGIHRKKSACAPSLALDVYRSHRPEHRYAPPTGSNIEIQVCAMARSHQVRRACVPHLGPSLSLASAVLLLPT